MAKKLNSFSLDCSHWKKMYRQIWTEKIKKPSYPAIKYDKTTINKIYLPGVSRTSREGAGGYILVLFIISIHLKYQYLY